MTTLQELRQQQEALAAQQAALSKAIAELRNEERKAAMAKIKELMAVHGLSAVDLVDAPSGKSKAPKADGSGVKHVAAKYRDPNTGRGWSGRGLKPRWMTAALAAGASLESLLITSQESQSTDSAA